MLAIMEKRKIWFSLSAFVVFSSLILWAVFGLNLGLDFTGGSLLEAEFKSGRPAIDMIKKELEPLGLKSLVVQPAGEQGIILRFQEIDENKHQEISEKLSPLVGADQYEELRFDSIGPSIGQELKRKSIYAAFFVLVAINLYIAWAFRKVSRPVESWKYGLAAIIALFHDVIIVIGVFVILGRFFNVEINTSFVAAILTVLGYSVNDTIIIFDRIRENLPRSSEDFESTINLSINQTLARSINTSMTVMLVLLAIVFFGGESVRAFSLALTVGVFVGTYSSIFLASPILVAWESWSRR